MGASLKQGEGGQQDGRPSGMGCGDIEPGAGLRLLTAGKERQIDETHRRDERP